MPYQAGFIFGPSPYDSSCLANTRSSRAALGLPSLACRVPYQAGFISRPSPGVFTWQSLGVREAHLGPPRKGQGGPCSITHMAMCFFFDWEVALQSAVEKDILASTVLVMMNGVNKYFHDFTVVTS